MPRYHRTLLLLLFLFHHTLLAAAESGSQRYARSQVPMQVQQVSPHVYYVQGAAGIATDNEGFISNAAFILTGDGVVVFDALGTPSLADALVRKIREITDQPIKRVIVSHYHADHIYGLQVFEELGAEILAPYGAQEYIQSEAARNRLEERQFSLEPWVNENTRLVLPDVTLERSMQFRMGEVQFSIHYLGKAHSSGDLTLLVEPDKVLLSGDIIFRERIPFVGSADSKKWLQTLTRLETGGLNVLIPGHGPASTAPQETISLTRRYLAYLREVMGAGVAEFSEFDEIYANADWSDFIDLPAFEESNRVNAYQVFLSMEAEMLAGD